LEETGYRGDLVRAVCDYLDAQPKGFTLQRRIPNHRYEHPTRGNEDAVKHDVSIVPGTLLHKLLGRDTIRIATFHDLSTPPQQTLVTVNAWHGNVVEGTEYGENILGVQGHPEIDALLPELFTFLAEQTGF
jgi:gamma-glutamyl-gamma-aminobutyrate hydrolase PuuD